MEKYTPIQLTLVSFTCCMQSLQSLISLKVFFTSCTQHLKVTTFMQVKSYLGILRLDKKNCPQLIEISMNKYSIHQALILTALRK